MISRFAPPFARALATAAYSFELAQDHHQKLSEFKVSSFTESLIASNPAARYMVQWLKTQEFCRIPIVDLVSNC